MKLGKGEKERERRREKKTLNGFIFGHQNIGNIGHLIAWKNDQYLQIQCGNET